MVKKKPVTEKQDAFDIASQKRKPGRPKKVVTNPHDHSGAFPHGADLKPAQEPESDDETMSEKETESLVSRAQERKNEALKKVGETIDSQEWTGSDPEIPEGQEGRVWVAVYKCPESHKTKATNRQARTGVGCWRCRDAGKTVKAEIMPQFLKTPEPPSDDIAKRKAARKAAE